MITTILLTIINFFLFQLVLFLPTTQVWPQAFLDGITYMTQCMAMFNFVVPIDTLFVVIIFMTGFFTIYFSAWIVMKVVYFFWGTPI